MMPDTLLTGKKILKHRSTLEMFTEMGLEI